ncbi:P-loop containing nucleoside triphosphate hydrolase protein, partial [Gorgonomyces haynaldii]
IATQSASQLAMESENKMLKIQLDQFSDKEKQQALKIQEMEQKQTQLLQSVAEMEEKLRHEEMVRRQLHNTIQELKGNIRVFCRVRPLMESEKAEVGEIAHLSFAEETSIELIQSMESASGSKLSKSYPFTFDKVFQPESTQKQVFEEISQLVQSALDGYNVCIFAYGQTGSGKTFTMEGPGEMDGPNDQKQGMIPRAVQQIFQVSEKLQEKGWEYQMSCQYLEIYNETLRDLLGNGTDKKYDIKHDKGKTTVTEANVISVSNSSQVFDLLKKASANRAVASTNCNERSSRSHSVFTLFLTGSNSITQEQCQGTLNLIDLAGSERLSSSGSTGDRLKETQAINKSLSCLGDVIFALSNKENHIPYRNSKLTYLLQNSLGGNSKTLMFVNVSPMPASFQETLCSLRFATKVNSCQIGTAKRQTK